MLPRSSFLIRLFCGRLLAPLVGLMVVGIPITHALASACCGGGSALPSVITSDDKAQFSISTSKKENLIDVGSDGVWSHRQDRDVTETQTLSYAHIFRDRFQWGASLPLQTRQNSNSARSDRHQAIGDLSAQVGYEYLPDWDYNPWRPKGVGFVTLSAPTGKSVYELLDFNGVEAHGKGYGTLGIGTSLTKTFDEYDGVLTFEAHRGISRSFDLPEGRRYSIVPGWGTNTSLGLGYNRGNWRLGASLATNFEEAIQQKETNPSTGQTETTYKNSVRFSEGSLSLSYLFPEQISGNLSLSDQTIFGDPSNSSLGKSISLSLLKRWSR